MIQEKGIKWSQTETLFDQFKSVEDFSLYLKNGSILPDKQQQSNSTWYKEYLFLEYNTEFNAIFCTSFMEHLGDKEYKILRLRVV